MEKHYDTDGFDVYMLIPDMTCQPSYETEMLQRNHINGVLDMSLRYVDGEGYPCYKVSGLIEYETSLQNLRPEQIMQLFQAVFYTIRELRQYLLVMNDLVLQEDMIFYDERKRQYVFTYVPGYQISIRMQMRALLERSISRMDHTDRTGSDKIYDLYQKISEEYVDLEDLGAELDRIMSGSDNAKFRAGQPDVCVSDRGEAVREKEYGQQAEDFCQRDDKAEAPMHNRWNIYKGLTAAGMILTFFAGVITAYLQYRRYGRLEQMKPLFGICILLATELLVYIELDKHAEDELLCDNRTNQSVNVGGEMEEDAEQLHFLDTPCDAGADMDTADTQILNTGQPYGMFVSLSGYSEYPEMVYVTQLPALIGRGDMADCRLRGESISRVHAKLAYADANFILEDIESTNGTFVNDYPLKKGYPVLLLPGDEVSFGSERYEFRVC